MKGNVILLKGDPNGAYEGIVNSALFPGVGVALVVGTAPIGGRFTYDFFNQGADGDPVEIVVLLDDVLQGGLPTTQYQAGKRARLYVPRMGDELNMLVADVAGTGDTHVRGDRMMLQNGTGKLVVQTDATKSASFQLMEGSAALTADTLMWCRYTGGGN